MGGAGPVGKGERGPITVGGAAFTLRLDAKYPGHGFKAAACQSLTTTDERVCIYLVHTACGCAERMGRLFQVILLDCCSVYVRMCLTMGGGEELFLVVEDI